MLSTIYCTISEYVCCSCRHIVTTISPPNEDMQQNSCVSKKLHTPVDGRPDTHRLPPWLERGSTFDISGVCVNALKQTKRTVHPHKMAARKTKQQSAVLWWIPFHLLLVSFALKFMYPSNSKLSKSPNYSIMYALCLPHGYNLRFSRFSKLALSLSFVFFSSQVLLIKKCTSSAVPFVLPSTKTTKKGMAFVFPLHFPIFFSFVLSLKR